MNFTRESIFVSTIRSFFNAFAALVGIGLAIFVVILGIAAVANLNKVSLPDKGDLTVSADAQGSRKLLPETTPVILRINIHGVIGTKDLDEKTLTNLLLSSREGVLAKNRVKGILLHMNTPGGIATDSNSMYRALKNYKEKFQVPVLAYVEGMCASGGMYIAAAADKIFASKDSLVGSIGVRMGPVFNFFQTMEKIGVQSRTFTEGKNKDMLNPFRPWKEGEDASIKAIIASEYEQFVDIMTSNRKQLSKEKLINEYGAQIYIAPKGEEIGYVDNGNIDYSDALRALSSAAGIEKEYQVLTIEPPHSVLQELAQNKFGILRGKVEHVFPIGPYITSDMSGKLLYLYQP